MAAAASTGELLLDTTVAVSIAAFARLARSPDFFRSTRPETKMTKQEVVELGDWVPWEFQSEDQEAPSNSENCEEVVPNPPAGVSAQTVAIALDGEGGEGGASAKDDTTPPSPSPSPASDEKGSADQAGEADKRRPQQMYRKIRLRSTVSSPLGSSHNDGVQGQTLREGQNEVIYTETDCVTGLPMFRGAMAVKTTYRAIRDENDLDNSVSIKVTAFVRDVKLTRAMGWLGKLIQKSIKDSAKNQASQNLKKMVEAEAT